MRTTFTITLAVSVLAVSASSAQTRQNIQIAGSSTVLPFSSIIAEEFGATFPEFVTRVVASGGTGGGMRQFCEGVGPNTIDIANASQAIRPAELAVCNNNGVTDVREIMFGFDGIMFSTRADCASFALAPRDVFTAISASLPDGAAPTGLSGGPCSALDPIATAILENLITELAEQYTIAIVMHSMQQAARVSQQMAFFHLGKLIEFDKAEKVSINPGAQQTQDYITGRYG